MTGLKAGDRVELMSADDAATRQDFAQKSVYVARALGRDADAARYSDEAAALARRIHAHFHDRERHVYPKGLQVPTAFALMAGVVPPDLVAEQEAHFDDELGRIHPYLGMGSSGLPVLLKYLTEVKPHDALVAECLKSTAKPSYGYFLARGETAWPEYWSCDVPSKIHTCYTGISAWFVKRLAGLALDPAVPGGAKLLVTPNPVGGVKHVTADLETAKGKVSLEWKLVGTAFTLKLTLPEDTTAAVTLPDGTKHTARTGTERFYSIMP